MNKVNKLTWRWNFGDVSDAPMPPTSEVSDVLWGWIFERSEQGYIRASKVLTAIRRRSKGIRLLNPTFSNPQLAASAELTAALMSDRNSEGYEVKGGGFKPRGEAYRSSTPPPRPREVRNLLGG